MGAYRSSGSLGPVLPEYCRTLGQSAMALSMPGLCDVWALRCPSFLRSTCLRQPCASNHLRDFQRGQAWRQAPSALKLKVLKSTVGQKSIHFIRLSLEVRPQESWGAGVLSAAFGVEGRDWGRPVTAAFVKAPPNHPRNSGTHCPGAGSVLRFPGIQPVALLSGVL